MCNVGVSRPDMTGAMTVLAAVVGLAVIGAASLVFYGAAWKWCIFAAIALAVMVGSGF